MSVDDKKRGHTRVNSSNLHLHSPAPILISHKFSSKLAACIARGIYLEEPTEQRATWEKQTNSPDRVWVDIPLSLSTWILLSLLGLFPGTGLLSLSIPNAGFAIRTKLKGINLIECYPKSIPFI